MAQTQTPSIRYQQNSDLLDVTPNADIWPGDVVLKGSLVCVSTEYIPANTRGSVAYAGVFKCPKDTSVFADGAAVYWAATGSPVSGTASSGAMTSTSSGNTLAGYAVAAALTGDAFVTVRLLG